MGGSTRTRVRGRDSVLECASPLALSNGATLPKRQRTGALQDLTGTRRFMEKANTELKAAPEAAFFQEAIIMAHEKMGFHLAHGIQHDTHQN